MKAGWIIRVVMGTFVLSSPGMAGAAAISTSHTATASKATLSKHSGMGIFLLSSPGMAGAATSHSAPASAATLSKHGENESRIEMSNRCTSLERQFAEAIARNSETSDQVADAKALRSQGGSLCGNPQDGIIKLKSALHELGVPPRS